MGRARRPDEASSHPRALSDTHAPDAFTFKDPEKIRELARRGEAWSDSESRQMLEYGIEVGRGGCYLRLTTEQYRKLRHP